MKTRIVLTVAAGAALIISGCVTATGYAERTEKDGVVSTRAKYTLFGGGAAAQQAIQGLAIDGDKDAPGVALEAANNSQDSTSAIQALVRLGAILGPFMPGAPAAAPRVQATAPLPPDDVAGPASATSAPAASVPVSAALTAAKAEAVASGKPLVVLASDPACGYCAKLDRAIAAGGEDLLTRPDIVLYRESAPWANNAALRWTGGGAAPILRVTSFDPDGKVLCDKKVNRPQTVGDIEAAVRACVAP